MIRLEQNYRSTQNILNAANEVIVHNTERKPKTLWRENAEGDKIHFRQFLNGFEEAEYVIGDISKKYREGACRYRDCAILYRTNAQSRLFEEKCLLANIPYKIVGGVNFYARKEIKDLLSYMKTVDNAADDLAVRRILNVPKRGIGATTINTGAPGICKSYWRSAFTTPSACQKRFHLLARAQSKIEGFVTFIQSLKSRGSGLYRIKSFWRRS